MSQPKTPGRGESPAVVDSQQPRPGTHAVTPDADALDWRTRGACHRPEFSPDWWTGPWDELRQAIWVCHNACPVRVPCRRWANDNRPLVRAAVYGGIYWSSRTPASDVRPYTNQPVPRRPRPHDTGCGTQVGVSRHRRRGEPLDVECLAFDAHRKRQERHAA